MISWVCYSDTTKCCLLTILDLLKWLLMDGHAVIVCSERVKVKSKGLLRRHYVDENYRHVHWELVTLMHFLVASNQYTGACIEIPKYLMQFLVSLSHSFMLHGILCLFLLSLAQSRGGGAPLA